MCIIILNKAGKLSKSVLTESANNNSDGAGLMYAYKGKLFVFKSINCKSVISEYYKVRKTFKGQIALHFRIATDGAVNNETCHPYKVHNDCYLMHNGILHSYSNQNTLLSDTQLFIADLLNKFSTGQIFTPEFQKLLQLAINSGNKFVLMNNKGESAIINESAGNKDKSGNWFSNYSYEPYKLVTTTKTNKKAGYFSRYYDSYCDVCGAELITYKERTDGLCDYCSRANNSTEIDCNTCEDWHCSTCNKFSVVPY